MKNSVAKSSEFRAKCMKNAKKMCKMLILFILCRRRAVLVILIFKGKKLRADFKNSLANS